MKEVRTNEQKVADLFKADGVDLGRYETSFVDMNQEDADCIEYELIKMTKCFASLTGFEAIGLIGLSRNARLKIIGIKNKVKKMLIDDFSTI